MSEFQEGQTATNPKTGQKIVFRGGQWVNAGVGEVQRGELSVQDNKALNDMRDGHSAALKVNRDYREVARVLDRSQMTPVKASMLNALTPQEGGGFFDAIGGWIGSKVLPQQTIDDFQTLRGLQSGRVMDAQIAQKGPQTEADAARLQLAEVSPWKTKQANIAVMKRGMADATLAKRKLPFFQRWANKYGVNGVNERGQTADEAWTGVTNAVYQAAENMDRPKRKNDVPSDIADILKKHGGK